MLYLVGLGLGNERDITLNALDAINKCDIVYLENYTSLIGFDIQALENLIGKKINLVDREFVENEDNVLNDAKLKNVAFLVKGDVFSATTHSILFLKSKEKGIDIKFLHNTSILTAVGDTGLSLYKFGRVASIPFDYENKNTIFDIYLMNQAYQRMHTLFLLDLDPKNNRYMNFKDGLQAISDNGDGSFNLGTKVVVCAGLGTDKQVIKYGNVEDLLKINIEVYPQCIIIPGELHFMEEEILNLFKVQ